MLARYLRNDAHGHRTMPKPQHNEVFLRRIYTATPSTQWNEMGPSAIPLPAPIPLLIRRILQRCLSHHCSNIQICHLRRATWSSLPRLRPAYIKASFLHTTQRPYTSHLERKQASLPPKRNKLSRAAPSQWVPSRKPRRSRRTSLPARLHGKTATALECAAAGLSACRPSVSLPPIPRCWHAVFA
jgi:hypothetical protein